MLRDVNTPTTTLRTVREAIEIGADAASVWHALVRRDETPRWLGEGAGFDPRPEGACSATNLRGERFDGRVESFAATRRLAARATDGGSLELQLEPRARGTMVRVVRSLWLGREHADELANAEAREWRIGLLRLRAHVESQGSATTLVASAWSPLAREAAWATLFGAERLVRAGSVDQLQRRDGFHLQLAGDIDLAGRAASVEPRALFIGDAPGGEVLVLTALAGGERSLLVAALLGSRRPADQLDRLRASWLPALA
ncbi:MAG: hypothetical protein L6Q99_03865 [Planctomycetes bacterium]|nr:hypothetical protein [Planctomycetota bacterium]